MPTDHTGKPISNKESSPATDDAFLLASLLGGDAVALTKLMDRYDRLVRYTIFRMSREWCVRDPQWLESIASITWAGFVRSLRRDPDNPPASVRAYLVRITKNQVASALRGEPAAQGRLQIDEDVESLSVTAGLEDPLDELSRLEHLELLRDCLAELSAEDRALTSQLSAITDRRWTTAAHNLGMSESTLRSRWKRALERLRRCIEQKSGNPFAPRSSAGDF